MSGEVSISAPSTESAPPRSAPIADNGLQDALSDPLVAGPPKATAEAEPAPEPVDGGSAQHTLWTELHGDQVVVYCASKPLPIPTRLRRWASEAKKLKDDVYRKHIDKLLTMAWSKYELVKQASLLDDPQARAQAIEREQHGLAGAMGVLFKAFDIAYPGLGAVAVYRGLHFSTDWQAKRGRTVQQEAARSFEDVKSEGSYSSAVWDVAGAFATQRSHAKPTSKDFADAEKVVAAAIEGWLQTTDGNRTDDSTVGTAQRGKRAALDQGIAKATQLNNGAQAQRLTGLRDAMDTKFTHANNAYANGFDAALSRYIDNQKFFEADLTDVPDRSVNEADRGDATPGAWKNADFKSIPFISTSKVATEAVKYAEGKLANDQTRSTAGVVGRVLVYVAPQTAMVEAGGIDVWAGLQAGTLNFTTYRMAENEITFSTSIPDEFLRGMTEVHASRDTGGNAALAETEAATQAIAWGGLNPQPLNRAD